MKSNEGETEEVFSKLPKYGYSEVVAEKIWRWYHPSNKPSKTSSY